MNTDDGTATEWIDVTLGETYHIITDQLDKLCALFTFVVNLNRSGGFAFHPES